MKYAFKKIRRIILNDLATKEHKVTLNDLKSFSVKGSQETIYSEGTDGAKLVAFDINKVASLEASNGTIDEGYLALQVGGEVVKISNGSSILIREEFDVKNGENTVILSYKAVGATGNEVGYIYKADSNGTPANSYTQNATVSATEFTYDPDTRTVTLPTGAFNVGDTVIVDYYPTFSEYEEIANNSNNFSMSCEVIVDAWFTDLCTERDVPLQMYLAKGKISGEIDITTGDQAAVQNISIEALQSPCNSNNNLWVLRKYDMSNAVS